MTTLAELKQVLQSVEPTTSVLMAGVYLIDLPRIQIADKQGNCINIPFVMTSACLLRQLMHASKYVKGTGAITAREDYTAEWHPIVSLRYCKENNILYIEGERELRWNTPK